MQKSKYFILVAFTAILLISAVLTTVGTLAVSAFAARDQNAETPQIVPASQLSDSLRANYNLAMANSVDFNFAGANSPFVDKTNVSAETKQPAQSPMGAASGFPQTAVNRPFPSMPGAPSGAVMGVPSQTLPAQNVPQNPQLPGVPAAPPVDETKALLRERTRAVRLGKPVSDLAEVYAIDDVRPFGIVGSGETNFIKLYAPATSERFRVGRGSRLRDGVLVGISDNGVSFRRDSGAVVVVPFIKNIKSSDKSDQEAIAPRLKP